MYVVAAAYDCAGCVCGRAGERAHARVCCKARRVWIRKIGGGHVGACCRGILTTRSEFCGDSGRYGQYQSLIIHATTPEIAHDGRDDQSLVVNK